MAGKVPNSRFLTVAVSLPFACAAVALSAPDAKAPVSTHTPASATAASTSYYANVLVERPSVTAMTAVGRELFSDPTLSASGKIACSTCHDPSKVFGPPNDLPVQRGGADGHGAGVRAVPSLRYLQSVPPFTEHFFESDGNDSEDQGPAGGRTWDGRSQSAHDQARLPLFSACEMGNASPETLVAKVRSSPYAGQFRALFGKEIFDKPGAAFNDVLLALEVYQQNPAEFYPYSSKYDAWLRKQATLTAQEERGLALFNDPSKGNCASCHPSSIKNGAFPAFTDYGYIALGVPRNPAIPFRYDRNIPSWLSGGFQVAWSFHSSANMRHCRHHLPQRHQHPGRGNAFGHLLQEMPATVAWIVALHAHGPTPREWKFRSWLRSSSSGLHRPKQTKKEPATVVAGYQVTC